MLLCYYLLFAILILNRILDRLSYNGKGLCEVRATATGSEGENRTLAKTIFDFSKLQKNKKRNGFLRVFSRIFLRFPSTPHLAKPMLSAVFLLFKIHI